MVSLLNLYDKLTRLRRGRVVVVCRVCPDRHSCKSGVKNREGLSKR